jgi:Tfp pilus assembly protein PilF
MSSRSRLRKITATLAFAALAGCGSPPPPDEGYIPKIYAVEQQEKAAIALREGDEAEAEAAADRAIEHDPGYAPSYIAKATVLARRNDLVGARTVLDACLAQQPAFAEAHLLRGALQEELKQRDAARADYEQAVAGYTALLEKDPANTENVLKHAIAEYLRGGTAGIRAINQMVANFPDNALARFVRERMVAQDRAFAFRWLTGMQPGAVAPSK